ncbi:MAG: sodium:proton antiporter, partial [Crocosphaera sp.]
KKLNLVGDQPLRQEYSELLARKVALGRVIDYFQTLDESPRIDSEFYRYEKELVTGQLASIDEKINKFQTEYPHLKSVAMQLLKDKLLDIEADTYAELIRSGQLGKDLSPLILEILGEGGES